MHRLGIERREAAAHEAHALDARNELGEHGHSARALQGDQRVGVVHFEADACWEMLRDMGVVGVLAAGVDHQQKRAVALAAFRTRDHEIVENAAIGREELRVALLARLEIEDVGRDEGLERASRRCMIGPVQPADAHVAHVEEPGLLARPEVLLEHAERILHGHVVARERHHLGARGDVQIIEGSSPERRAGSRIGAHRNEVPRGSEPARPFARAGAPSVTEPERFRSPALSGERPYPFGEPALPPAAFQSAINLRSFCLRGSGAVAPSAPARKPARACVPVSSADVDWRCENRQPAAPVNRRLS